MAMKFQDYYQTLGVKRDASQDDIKKAFRTLARKYHPDVNKEESAKGRFEQINEAYEVLSDPEKRKKYDTLGKDWKHGQDFRPPPGHENMHFSFGGRGGGGFESADGFSDFFNTFFQSMNQGSPGTPGTPGSGGAGRGFGGGFGRRSSGGASGGYGASGGRRAKPRDTQLDFDITLHDALHGSTRQVRLQIGQDTQTLDVRIPKGVSQGSKIRLKDHGVVLQLNLVKDPNFDVDGRNLIATVPIDPATAALGGKADCPTPDGPVSLTIPAGTSSGAKLRLKGKGLPAHGNQPQGDILAVVKITVPKTLTDEERELYEQLRELDSQPLGSSS